jgi:translation initiation factor 4A
MDTTAEISKSEEKEKDMEEAIKSFDELDISPNLLRGIFSYGFETPSLIQSTAIKPMIEKRNLIAQAQSGTGKTGAFSIGALSRVVTALHKTQILILSPTRELAGQSAGVITKIGSMMPELHVKTIVGGTAIRDDARDMQRTIPHVIVGCPGRVYDMVCRKLIELDQLRLIVLDEADEMLSTGFEEQIYNIFQMIPETATVALFSATLPPDILRISARFMKDPVTISVAADKLSLDGIKQYYVSVENDQQKYETLKDLYQNISMAQCIIYCNSVQRVCTLYDAMMGDQFPACCIHGKMDRGERERAFNQFKTGESRVLISSDVTARGIDVQQVNMVINFDVPSNVHNYLHRIGRSGRWGRKGTAINMVVKRDKGLVEDIEAYYCCQIDPLTEEVLGR